MTRLLDDLLDLSVLENGAVQLNLGLAHLGELLDVPQQWPARPDPTAPSASSGT